MGQPASPFFEPPPISPQEEDFEEEDSSPPSLDEKPSNADADFWKGNVLGWPSSFTEGFSTEKKEEPPESFEENIIRDPIEKLTKMSHPEERKALDEEECNPFLPNDIP